MKREKAREMEKIISLTLFIYREYAKYSEALETNMWNMLSKANNVVTETFHNIRCAYLA